MKILILGGSKFMGLNLLDKLIKNYNDENLNIYVINRGNVYWDGYFYDLIKYTSGCKKIEHYKTDRKNKEEMYLTLQKITDNFTNDIDFIIDFSCYKKKQLKILFENVKMSFKFYIFISTDSTYNASPIALERNEDYFFTYENFINSIKSDLITEDKAIMSDDKSIRKKLKQRDDYGYNKLKCEIEIKNYFKENVLSKNGKSFIILRLPDVIGSYDETFRLWYYIEWIKNSHLKPIEFEKIDLIRKISFVSKEDVVDLIIRIIFKNNIENFPINDYLKTEFNIASGELLTLPEIIDYIASKLQVEYKKEIVDYSALTYYPSVTMGAIDISKAKKTLNFEPRSIFQAFDKGIEFFNYLSDNKDKFEKEHLEMLEDLPEFIKNKINI